MTTEKTKKKKRFSFGRIAGAVIGITVLIYVGYQVFSAIYAPYTTETAAIYNVTDEIVAHGVAVRDELTLSDDTDGAFVYLISDGDKIAKNARIATVYPTTQAVLIRTMIDKYEDERDLLISLTNSSVEPSEFDGASSRLYEAIREYSDVCSDNSVADYSDALLSLTEKIGIYDLHVGRDVNYSERIQELNSAIDRLNNLASAASSEVLAPQTGYFITNTDGFETLVNKESVLEMSAAEISALLETEPSYAGGTKIVSGYEWYYVAVVDGSYASRFTVGASLTLNFRYAGVTDIPAKIVKVETDADTDRAVVIFSCDYFNAATAALRLDSATISFRNYSGIKIARSTLRLENGVLGVYIKYGSSVRFRSIEIIYDTDEYVIASATSATSGGLELYDEIIVSGRDLYVGKQLG